MTQHIIGLLAIGPCTALVMRTSLASRSNGIKAVLGAVVGSFSIKLLSVLGLSLILTQYPALFYSFKIVGAAYLIWLGIMCFMSSYKTFALSIRTNSSCANSDPALKRSPFLAGFLISMTNPLSSIRFIALFSTIITSQMVLAAQLSYLVVLAIISLVFYLLVALFFSTSFIQNNMTKYKYILDAVLGSTLIYWGIKIFKATL